MLAEELAPEEVGVVAGGLGLLALGDLAIPFDGFATADEFVPCYLGVTPR